MTIWWLGNSHLEHCSKRKWEAMAGLCVARGHGKTPVLLNSPHLTARRCCPALFPPRFKLAILFTSHLMLLTRKNDPPFTQVWCFIFFRVCSWNGLSWFSLPQEGSQFKCHLFHEIFSNRASLTWPLSSKYTLASIPNNLVWEAFSNYVVRYPYLSISTVNIMRFCALLYLSPF